VDLRNVGILSQYYTASNPKDLDFNIHRRKDLKSRFNGQCPFYSWLPYFLHIQFYICPIFTANGTDFNNNCNEKEITNSQSFDTFQDYGSEHNFRDYIQFGIISVQVGRIQNYTVL